MNSIIWFFSEGIFAAILFLLLWHHNNKRQKKRLLTLTAYLEAASCGKKTTLTRIEDEFSLLEDEIYKTVSELRIAHEQAQQKRYQQADNLADIAHQLKTPLISLSLMTQLLVVGANDEQQEYIKRIDNQLFRLRWLTDSLLTMSRLDANAVEFVPICITFEELIAQAIEPMQQLLEECKQTVIIHGKDEPLICDPDWTTEVLVNLIKNCSEHTPPNATIFLAASSTPLYQQMTVEDNGTGFSPEELPHLFQRFFRGKNSAKDSIGIGLALCRGIIEGQGGIIRAKNGSEGGACFIIRFYS